MDLSQHTGTNLSEPQILQINLFDIFFNTLAKVSSKHIQILKKEKLIPYGI